LAAPGAPDLAETQDLTAIWKTKDGKRFQNYKAVFTILDVDVVARTWIEALIDGKAQRDDGPDAWREWIETGVARPRLQAKH
tara:strand:+ start:49832 stop:50077 length:246 start_codon:yes stop_codon:yes gene_type:complete